MENALFSQLHKLSSAISEENLENVLETLWKTRKSGLKTEEKSSIQSLLFLPSLQELDPVLACLRSLVRKCVHENLTGDDYFKLFPQDLSPDLQSVLVLLLQKYQNKWKEEISRDQTPWQRPSISYVKNGVPPSPPSISGTNMPSSMWPQQHDPITRFKHNDIGRTTPIVADMSVPCVPPLSRIDGPDNLGILPRLKSMTWTMENRNSHQANRVSIISMKLQDFTKSPSGEREVKFQLTKDTLEAMLRSLTYISKQLNNNGGASSGPLQKKPRI